MNTRIDQMSKIAYPRSGAQGCETCGERADHAGWDDADCLRGRERPLAQRGGQRCRSSENHSWRL